MRPLHGEETWAARRRQRAPGIHDSDAHAVAPSAPGNYMSFCITDEASLDSHRGRPAIPAHVGDLKQITELPQLGDRDQPTDDALLCSPFSRASALTQSPASILSQAHPSSESRPITPIMLSPPCAGSAGSASSSRRNSFTSSLSDHAINYDQASASEPAAASSMIDSGSAPQLVMPSINMPSRRPFTNTGKSIGRLKILLAGNSGVGKTSLLKAIVQTCDHIVHIDPISPLSEIGRAFPQPDVVTASSRKGLLSTTTISEVYASTKPYPEWWQELETPSGPHKRKRRGDSVLERNICFVDTPGYGRDSSAMETIISCVDYVESHLSKVSSGDLSDSDLMNMLGGDGGCQVDVALYLIPHSLKPADFEYIRRLSHLTNVIPVLSRAELLSEEQTAACKRDIARQLGNAGIRPFTFTPTLALEKEETATPSIPYTVSSATVSDYDTMDASLLMSPDYVQPLIPTDLAFLVEKIFSLDGAPLAPPVPDYPSALARLSVALARRPGLQQDGGIAQAQVASWATELQRSLASEKLRYEALSRGERAVWLTERIHECVQDGTLVVARAASQSNRR
ncbi:hypothetical protein NUW58_g735 [Xylaria curta]|uniref:Uncharacterized protein n=1 Tax=Xylaria curta TaxID=42375 RepID=A0ACC1PP98_9PEZI|nr:hypothetical protein NUW58_g735 [Xylaria curta]